MLRNFFKITIRNLWKNKAFSLINISGLALGLAVFMIIMLWVKNEMGYDGFHKDRNRIAMTITNQTFGNNEIQTYPAVPTMLGETMKKDLPAVEYSALVSWGDQRMFTYGEKNFIENGLYAGADFLKIFSFPLLKGNPEKVLTEPNTVLISEKLAKKYFGEQDPLGKMISIEKTLSYKIEGILKDVPENSTVKFDFLMPVKDYIDQTMSGNKSWEYGNIRTFVKLKDGVNRAALDASLKRFMDRYTDKQKNAELALFNLNDWYLRWDFKNGKYAGGGRITYVNLFTVIAVFILMLACINFMNLSTARATQRSKEVGVRKVIGAGKQSLITQFIGESIIISVIAAVIAVAMVSLTIPVFNTLLSKHIIFDYTDSKNWLVLVSIILITGLLAGSYPAIVLSSFKPVKVLKGLLDNSAANTAGVRKVLVVTQFAVSVMLITGTLVVSKQVDYIRNKNLGYNKENLVWFGSNIDASKQQTAVQEFLKIPGVTNVAQASMTFVAPNNGGPLTNWPGKRPDQEIFFNFLAGGYDIIKTMGITMKEGRDFSAQLPLDSSSVIINETAAAVMGIKDPLGREIETYAGKMKIVGVTKDFHFESMHNVINPLVIMCRPDWTWLFYVRATGTNMPQVLKGLEQSYAKLAPGFVFDYNFQDKEYERLYRSEQQIGTLVNWFSFFAIFISSLGLLGLTIFTVERKTKEIGIRKVLGASVASIISLVSKQFIWLIILAFAVAVVPAWYFMNNWLQNFVYRTNLNWWVFGIAGGIVVLIALLTVSIMTITAASANPVKSLRTE